MPIVPLELLVALWGPRGEAGVADARFELGRAYFGAGETRRGRALVLQAKAAYERHADATDPAMHAALLASLASHGQARDPCRIALSTEGEPLHRSAPGV